MRLAARSSLFVTLGLGLGLAACGGGTHAAPPAGSTTTTAPAAVAPPPLIPRAVLFGNPERTMPKISPDGKHLAFTMPAEGVMNVFVAPVGDVGHPVQVTFDKTRPIGQFSWSVDGRWVIYQQDAAGDENFHVFRVGIDGKNPLDLTPGKAVRAQIFGTSHARPGVIAVGVNARDPQLHDVFEVDLATGKSTLRLENTGYADFTLDDELKVRFASTMEADGGNRWYVRDPNGKFTELGHVAQADSLTTTIAHFEASGRTYYVLDSRDRETSGLFAVDAGTGKRTLVAEDAKADAGQLLTHPTTDAIRAVRFERARMEWKVVDPSIAPDLAALAKVDEGDLVGPDHDRRRPDVDRGDRQ